MPGITSRMPSMTLSDYRQRAIPTLQPYLVNCRVLSARGFHVDARPSAVCLCFDVRINLGLL
jgi:hypothetical protein